MWSKSRSSFFCIWWSSYLSTMYWKDSSSSIECSLYPYWKSADYMLGFISGFSILFCCLSLCQYYTIWLQYICIDNKLVIGFESKCKSCNFILFQDFFWLFWVPCIWILGSACQYLPKSGWNFYRLCLICSFNNVL